MNPSLIKMDPKKFRIILNMSNFFHDHRGIAYILISNKMNSIFDLENKISEMFGIEYFYLTCQDKYLPTKEDIALLEKDDVVWVIPKSFSNLETCKSYKNIKIEEKNKSSKEIQNWNNLPFSKEGPNNVDSFEHNRDHFDDKTGEPKKKKKKREVSSENKMSCKDKKYGMETDTKACDINNDTLIENEETNFKVKTKKVKKKKYSIDNGYGMETDTKARDINDDTLIENEETNFEVKTKKVKRKKSSIDNEYGMETDTKACDINNDTLIENEETHFEGKIKKVKRKKYMEEINTTNEIDAEKKPRTSKKEFLVASNDFVDSCEIVCKNKKKKQKRNELNDNNESELAKTKSKKHVNGDIDNINTNGYDIEPSAYNLEQTSSNCNNIAYKNKKTTDKTSTDFSTLKDSHSQNPVNSSYTHNIQDVEPEGEDTVCDSFVSINSKLDHNNSENKDLKIENKSKAVINSHYIINPDGNVLQQSVLSEKEKADTDVSLNNDNYSVHHSSSRFSVARLLADLRSQSPNSVVSSETNNSFKRKRIRKRKRKIKEQVEYKVQPNIVVAQKPLIIPVKPALHIKFDVDSNEEECSEKEIPPEENSNVKSALANPIRFVPASITEVTKEILEKSSEIQKESKTQEASRIAELEVPSKQSQENSLICDSAKISETTNNTLHSPSEQVERENDLLIGTKTKSITSLHPPTDMPNETKVVTPTVGATLCFKIFRLNADYTPEISSNIVGNVQHYDSVTNKITLKIIDGLDQCVCPTGKFHLDFGEEEPEEKPDIKEFDWPELIEPKLFVLPSQECQ